MIILSLFLLLQQQNHRLANICGVFERLRTVIIHQPKHTYYQNLLNLICSSKSKSSHYLMWLWSRILLLHKEGYNVDFLFRWNFCLHRGTIDYLSKWDLWRWLQPHIALSSDSCLKYTLKPVGNRSHETLCRPATSHCRPNRSAWILVGLNRKLPHFLTLCVLLLELWACIHTPVTASSFTCYQNNTMLNRFKLGTADFRNPLVVADFLMVL